MRSSSLERIEICQDGAESSKNLKEATTRNGEQRKPARKKTETRSSNSRPHVTTFNLEPEFIPANRDRTTEDGDETGEEELTPAELRQLKEDSQKRVKRIVAAVGITLTVISIILVALSLSFGQKIDDLVGKKYDSHTDPSGGAKAGDQPGFFLGAKPTNATFDIG